MSVIEIVCGVVLMFVAVAIMIMVVMPFVAVFFVRMMAVPVMSMIVHFLGVGVSVAGCVVAGGQYAACRDAEYAQ